MLVGAGIAGMVAYQEMSHSETVVDPIPMPVAETQASTAVAESPGSAANTPLAQPAGAEASAANAVAVAPKVDQVPVPKKADQARKAAVSDPGTDIENLVGPDDEVVMKGDTLYVGKIKIQDGKVYMPDGTVHDAPKKPRIPGVQPPVPPVRLTEEQLRQLTPDQRRKLRMIRERFPGTFSQPTPNPYPNK
jgi:hypothetical protein